MTPRRLQLQITLVRAMAFYDVKFDHATSLDMICCSWNYESYFDSID